jgi:aryl-alcohol dehydrogenase-like predicted oxidoreductase
MKQRNIGKSNLRVSVVGLGCNNFGMITNLEKSRAVIESALDHGITFFDTADIYGNRGGSETILGQVLGNRRKDIVLATKVGKPMDDAGTMQGASRRYIMSALEASLKRLKTDWIDLYQIHQPDPDTPQDETMKTLEELIRQGKVRYVGCSNFPAWKVVESRWISRIYGIDGFVSCQDNYSLLARTIEWELLPAMESYDLGLLPYFPLAGGLLTGKYKRNRPAAEGTRFAAWKDLAQRYTTEANWNLIESLEDFCAERSHTLLELAFAWLLAKPIVSSIIAGATKPEQIEKNVAAADWILSQEDLGEIDRLTRKNNPN